VDINLTDKLYSDESLAREYLEGIRWPNGPVCPHCGEVENVHRLEGGAHRAGLLYCRSCRGQFSVTVGTCFERSHVPLTKWVLATHLLCSSKKGMSSHQLSRMLDVTYKTAWFMSHRIREGMINPNAGPIGGTNKAVEVDETYVGGKAKNRKSHVPKKTAVVALVERNGEVRAQKVSKVNATNLKPILAKNAQPKSWILTDDSPIYPTISQQFAGHRSVNHSAGEYVRGVFHHTNTVENFFSILKRGLNGVYHHVGEQHLDRYVAEFGFRYNNRSGLGIDDAQRARNALKGIEGKRLTYRRTDGASA
jgi:transposase-like protein